MTPSHYIRHGLTPPAGSFLERLVWALIIANERRAARRRARAPFNPNG